MKYTFPKPKKSKNKAGAEICVGEDYSWHRRLELRCDSLEGVEIGEEVTITIKARVTGLELREREGQDKHSEMVFDMDSFTLEGKNEFAELAED